MDRERWRRIEEILDQALEAPPERREEIVERLCAGDSALRQEVDRLLASDARAEGFLEGAAEGLAVELLEEVDAPVDSALPSLEGTELGPYRLRRQIGAGGMGVIYEAVDTRLDRRVAVKILPPETTRSSTAKERFRREARAASALDHPSICTIHDIGESEEGHLYFVMSYYPGETLEERLADGPLPVEEARRIALQVARGLRHAHRAGITHRDIKPSNVILTEESGAKILDFGIARVGGSTELTRTGASVGTPSYMSPEQSRGAAVDPRSDLWSLGVVLYEMLAGRRPFRGDNALAVMNAILTQEPEPLAEQRPDAPLPLRMMVQKLLEKDPGARYASADELLSDLGSGTAPTVSAARLPARARRWRAAAWAAALAVLLLGVPWLVPASRHALLGTFSGGGAAAAPRLVVVLPFINSLEPTPENHALADGLTHSVTGLVARLGAAEDSLWIVPSNEVVQQEVSSAADARALFGVDTVVTGSVQRAGARTEILLSVVDPTVVPPRAIRAKAIAAPLGTEGRDSALAGLADLLEIGSAPLADLASELEEGTTPAAQALYLQAIGYLRSPDQAGNIDAAIEAFGGALEEDSRYAPAHAGLCEALWLKHRLVENPALASEALASCERAADLAAGEAPVLVSVGASLLEQGELGRARDELERALTLDPENAEAHRWLGWVANEEGRLEEAEAALRKAVELEPRTVLYAEGLGEFLNIRGRYTEAIEVHEESRRLAPGNYLTHNLLAVAYGELNQIDKAEEHFLSSAELHPTALAYRNLGNLYFREQRYREAVEALEKARDLLEDSPSFNGWIVWNFLGHAYYWSGEEEAAREAWQRLVEVATPLYEVNPRDTDVLALLADTHVALGDRERGRYYLDRLLTLSLSSVYLRYYIGRSFEMMGDRGLALTYITQSLEDGFSPRTVDRDPWLAGLHQEPSYKALRQRFMRANG